MYVICRLYCFVVRRVTGIATGLRCTPPSFRLQINTFQYFSLFKCVFCSTAKGEEADPACSIVCAWYHTHQMLQHCRFPRGESAGKIVSLYLILGTYRQLFTASCCPPTHIHAKYQVYHLRRTARLTWYPFCGTRICYTRSTSHPKYIAAFLLGLLHLADGRRKIYKTCTRRTFEYRYGMSEIFQPRAAHGCRPSLFIVLSVASSTSN